MSNESKWSRHTKVHFSLGNDFIAKASSYQTDYGQCCGWQQKYQGKPAPPPAAEVLPHADRASEREKWLSSTMRDFVTFGNDARTQAYQTSRKGFKEAKHIQTKNMGLLRDNYRPFTSYDKDFREAVVCPSDTPEYRSLTRASLRRTVNGRENISEARHAFQWPTKDRLKIPLHWKKSRQ